MEEAVMNRLFPSVRRGLLVLAAIGAAAAASLAVGWHQPARAKTQPMQMSGMITAPELRFRNEMRVLWEEDVTWTRLAIVGFAGGLADLPATEHRLLQNQDDIGDAIAPFYGDAAGEQLTGLLRRHILIAVRILNDVKTGNTSALAADQKRWYANANQIAAFLHAANPHHWGLAALRQMMHRHLALTTSEAVDELSGKYAASVDAYDQVEREILGMADMLSTGIIRQFPHRF
jgi:hypothetical protein